MDKILKVLLSDIISKLREAEIELVRLMIREPSPGPRFDYLKGLQGHLEALNVELRKGQSDGESRNQIQDGDNRL